MTMGYCRVRENGIGIYSLVQIPTVGKVNVGNFSELIVTVMIRVWIILHQAR